MTGFKYNQSPDCSSVPHFFDSPYFKSCVSPSNLRLFLSSCSLILSLLTSSLSFCAFLDFFSLHVIVSLVPLVLLLIIDQFFSAMDPRSGVQIRATSGTDQFLQLIADPFKSAVGALRTLNWSTAMNSSVDLPNSSPSAQSGPR